MTLFHYTTIDTLFAIIKGIDNQDENNIRFTLRATHVGFLNDMTEGQMLGNALRKLGITESLLDILNRIRGLQFVVSLSELEDDLNMWRCYADQGKGVSIGLDNDVIIDAMQHQFWGHVADFGKCRYCTEEELVEYLKENGIIEKLHAPNILPLAKLMSEALIFKHKSFHAENEWRIYANYIESDFRVCDNLVIPFYNIILPIDAMVSITFGPKCDYERNCFSTSRLIRTKLDESLAEKIKMNKSVIPLI